jgi:hypothetical protein
MLKTISPKRKDYKGQRFGTLMAIEDAGRSFHGNRIWRFKCDCGETVEKAMGQVQAAVNSGYIPRCHACQKTASINRIDRRGQRFGKLVAIRGTGQDTHRNRIWRFQCDCGRTFDRIMSYVLDNAKNGGSPCCPTCQEERYDITGQVFGSLTALHKVQSLGKGAIWSYQCKCGAIVRRVARSVTKSATDGYIPCCGKKACGAKHDTRLSDGESAIRGLIHSYKKGAKKREIEFSLTRDELEHLFGQNCYFCGIEPAQIYRTGSRTHSSPLIYNGIDRLDNSKGYVTENVVPCCGRCNKAKNNMPYDVFMSWIDRLIQQRVAGKI